MEQIFSFGERWNVPFNSAFASLNGTFHLSPHENICTIALINIHYLYTNHFDTVLLVKLPLKKNKMTSSVDNRESHSRKKICCIRSRIGQWSNFKPASNQSDSKRQGFFFHNILTLRSKTCRGKCMSSRQLVIWSESSQWMGTSTTAMSSPRRAFLVRTFRPRSGKRSKTAIKQGMLILYCTSVILIFHSSGALSIAMHPGKIMIPDSYTNCVV